jgi:hypothetical protein
MELENEDYIRISDLPEGIRQQVIEERERQSRQKKWDEETAHERWKRMNPGQFPGHDFCRKNPDNSACRRWFGR